MNELKQSPYIHYIDVESTNVNDDGEAMWLGILRVWRDTGEIINEYSYRIEPTQLALGKASKAGITKYNNLKRDNGGRWGEAQDISSEILMILRGPNPERYAPPPLYGYCIRLPKIGCRGEYYGDLPLLIRQFAWQYEWIASPATEVCDIALTEVFRRWEKSDAIEGRRTLENVAVALGIDVSYDMEHGIHTPLYDCKLAKLVFERIKAYDTIDRPVPKIGAKSDFAGEEKKVLDARTTNCEASKLSLAVGNTAQDEFNARFHKTLWHLWETITRIKKDGCGWNADMHWFANKMREYGHYDHDSSPEDEICGLFDACTRAKLLPGWTPDVNALGLEMVIKPFCLPKFNPPNWRPIRECAAEADEWLKNPNECRQRSFKQSLGIKSERGEFPVPIPKSIFLYTLKFVLHDVVENKDLDQGIEVVDPTGVNCGKSLPSLVYEVVKKRNPTVPHPELWLNPSSRYRIYTEVTHVEERKLP